MLTLPAELTRLYETLLTQQGVASQHRPYYLKWLHYYWDFCHKYGFEPRERQSFPPFDEKLRVKHQSDFQRRQARHAVALYHELALTDRGGWQRPRAGANWCEKGRNESNDPDNNRADWWFPHPVVAAGSAGAPGTGSTKFTDVDLTQDTFWTTLTVNNTDTNANPAVNCPGGALHEVAVQPAGTEIDTYLSYSPFTKDPAPY